MSCCKNLITPVLPFDRTTGIYDWISSTTGSGAVRGTTWFQEGQTAYCSSCDQQASTMLNLNIPLPKNYGYLAWNFDPTIASAVVAPDAGNLHMTKVSIQKRAIVSAISVGVYAAGTNLTAGQNFLGIYDQNGVLLATTGDITDMLLTTGYKEFPLTTLIALDAGVYYIALLVNGATTPTLWSAPANYNMVSHNGTVPGFALASGPFTVLPDPLPAVLESNATAAFFVALL